MTVSLVKPPSTWREMYPAWTELACYCCNGMQWGGEYPRECQTCGGNGAYWLSPSGTRLAVYPGGPFCGVADESDRKKAGRS